jgi:hypothetical protein
MAKGYAEGSALEERLAELERAQRAKPERRANLRMAVFGSTAAQPESHFLGWYGEVDEDALFADGTAYGITYRRVPVPTR